MTLMKRRVINEALYLISNSSTIRDVARYFNVSKSTVHNDFSKRLRSINIDLYNNVKEILDYNFRVKHLRGGEATKIKYNLFIKSNML